MIWAQTGNGCDSMNSINILVTNEIFTFEIWLDRDLRKTTKERSFHRSKVKIFSITRIAISVNGI